MENLTQKSIGNRISIYRKIKGLSQEELAEKVGISRPSLTQVELGKRAVSAIELKVFSIILGFSMDKFMADNFILEEPLAVYEVKEKEEIIRNSVPYFNLGKFNNVLLYILEKTAGKPNVGETVLCKLLYFCDFNYYELFEEHLTGSTYKKLPYGPVPQMIDTVLDQLVKVGKIKRLKTNYFGLTQIRYIPLVTPNLKDLKASEKQVIDVVLAQMSDWSAIAISNYSHNDIPWVASKEGEDISYELAFYREAPYSVRTYREDES